jgi:LPS export ABC transporter protein LptC
MMRKRRRLILLIAILLSLGGVAYKVGESIWIMKLREIKENPLRALDSLPESALHMRDFHRSKIEDGRKVWELFGEEANYYKEEKQAVIKKPRFYYYDKKGEIAQTTGETARIFINEKELERMQLAGGIEVSYQGYTLRSEEAIYLPAKQQIVLPSRAVVIGQGIELEGSSMEVQLEEKTMRLLQNVKSRIEPAKLAVKKKKSATTQATGE